MKKKMLRLPEYIQFKADMEKAGHVVAIYDDGTPFVHSTDPFIVSRATKVNTDYFTEKFDGATKCVFPVTEHEYAVLLAISKA